jgi:hypothetical protein
MLQHSSALQQAIRALDPACILVTGSIDVQYFNVLDPISLRRVSRAIDTRA